MKVEIFKLFSIRSISSCSHRGTLPEHHRSDSGDHTKGQLSNGKILQRQPCKSKFGWACCIPQKGEERCALRRSYGRSCCQDP